LLYRRDAKTWDRWKKILPVNANMGGGEKKKKKRREGKHPIFFGWRGNKELKRRETRPVRGGRSTPPPQKAEIGLEKLFLQHQPRKRRGGRSITFCLGEGNRGGGTSQRGKEKAAISHLQGGGGEGKRKTRTAFQPSKAS